MSGPDNCAQCGSPLPGLSSSGPCPRCQAEPDPETSVPTDASTATSTPDETVSLAQELRSVLARIGETVDRVPHVHLRDTDIGDGAARSARAFSHKAPGTGQPSERYQFFGEIARGGMGAVLRGRDVDLGRELALKVLLESHREKPEFIRRFVEEAQIAGQLQHPEWSLYTSWGHFPTSGRTSQ
jgi:eukaryotic-like serine/threonine-protein kinase